MEYCCEEPQNKEKPCCEEDFRNTGCWFDFGYFEYKARIGNSCSNLAKLGSFERKHTRILDYLQKGRKSLLWASKTFGQSEASFSKALASDAIAMELWHSKSKLIILLKLKQNH